jgi:hypothetical protein
MMKRNRHLFFKGLILLVMAAFTFSTAYAQEEKEEKNVEVIDFESDGWMFFSGSIRTLGLISEDKKNMLEESGVKMGKEPLKFGIFKIHKDPQNDSIKVEFTARELKNLKIALYAEDGKQLYLEELKVFEGKYIREIEIPGSKQGIYFLQFMAGKESMTLNFVLDSSEFLKSLD